MPPSDRPSKAQRREEARQEALRLRQEQERTAKRRRVIAISAAGAVLLGFAVLVVVILTSGGTPEAEQNQPSFAADGGGGVVLDADGVVVPPADADESWPVGAFGDAVVVSVYSDPICPACGLFEATAGVVLEELREDGEVVLDHRLVGALDRTSMGTQYSTRAAQAMYTVAEVAPEAFPAFHTALMTAQPAEGTTGLSDEEIAEIARGSGVPEVAIEAIAENRYTWWVGQVTEAARERFAPRFYTPTVLLDGEMLPDEVDWRDEDSLRQSIEDARG